jgi:hypothetical protein
MNAPTASGRAETVRGDPIELEIAGGEIAALPENLDRGETPRKRSCVGKNDCAAVNRIHRVEIVAGVDGDGIESEEPIVEALSADRSTAIVSGKAASAGAENLVRDDVPRAPGAVAIGSATHRGAERVEVHQEPRNIAVRHEQVALCVHGDAGRLNKARVVRRTWVAIVRAEAAAAGPEHEVRRLAG